MKLKTTAMALSILFFLAFIIVAAADENGEGAWKLVYDQDGITVENRTLEGFKMKQLRARCEIEAPVEVIFEVMDDAESYHEWFGDCLLQKTVYRFTPYDKISYHVVDVPWPLNDRDSISRVTTNADWEAGFVETHVVSIRNPKEASKWGMDVETEKNGRVRMPVMDGVFTYRTIGQNRSAFTYIAIADPGIALPGWLLNAFSTKQPITTLKNLQKQVKKSIYWELAGKRHNKAFTPPADAK